MDYISSVFNYSRAVFLLSKMYTFKYIYYVKITDYDTL